VRAAFRCPAVSVIDENPLWFPQSFFSRTLWLVLIVVLFSKALTWFIC
jgi:hypothetical protein